MDKLIVCSVRPISVLVDDAFISIIVPFSFLSSAALVIDLYNSETWTWNLKPHLTKKKKKRNKFRVEGFTLQLYKTDKSKKNKKSKKEVFYVFMTYL